MTIPNWPSSLPISPLLDSYQETYTSLAQSVTSGNKSLLVRRNSTRSQDRLQVSFNLNKTQVSYFERFYYDTLAGGTLRFNFTHPRTGNVIEVSIDPTSDSSFTVTPNNSNFYYKLDLTLIVWN